MKPDFESALSSVWLKKYQQCAGSQACSCSQVQYFRESEYCETSNF